MSETDFKALSALRKATPVFDGFLQYFPLSIAEVSRFSRAGNDKHNPGLPLHWARHKSQDHANCAARHLIDIGPDWDGLDEELGFYHAVPLVWRSHALLETLLEAKAAGRTVLEHQAWLREQAK